MKEKKNSKEIGNQIKKEENQKNVNNMLSKTLKNTSSAFIISILSKIINLSCNIILIRHISKDAYGTAKIYLEFALSLVCFFPREAIRKTAQKFCPDKDNKRELNKYYLVCQIYISILFPMIICCLLLFIGFITFDSSGSMRVNFIHLLIYIFCGMLELLGEPIILYMNLHMENILIASTLGNFVRIISNVIFVVLFKYDLGAFTSSQIMGSFCYLIYILYLGKFKYKLNFRNFIPKNFNILFILFKKEKNIVDDIDISPLKDIFFQFIKLTVLNMILSNCENIILSFVLKKTNEEKSEYSFIIDNFSIITRMILKPVEDTFFNLINKLKNNENKNEKEKVTKENNNNNDNEIIFDVLKLFIKCLLIFGVLLICYYFLCGNELIELVYSKKWATSVTEKIGCAYSIYIAIISINGVIECFANATNDSNQMNLSYILLTLNSFLLVFFNFLLSNWDICGLILANAISMMIRINNNLYIIFCGKKQKKKTNENDDNKKYNTNLLKDIKKFQNNCFLSNSSIILTGLCIFFGYYIKKIIKGKLIIIKCGIFGFIGFLNFCFIVLCEYKSIKNAIKRIKGL